MPSNTTWTTLRTGTTRTPEPSVRKESRRRKEKERERERVGEKQQFQTQHGLRELELHQAKESDGKKENGEGAE